MKVDSNGISHTATAVGILVQLADGSIQSCNRDAEKILGYSAGEMIGVAASNIAIAFSNSRSVLTALETGQPCSDLEMEFYQPDGSLVWLSLTSQPLFSGSSDRPSGVVTTFKDITAAKRDLEPADSQKLELSKDFKLFADAIPGILYIFDAISQRNLYINSQAYDSLGYSPKHILEMGQEFKTKVMHPDDLALFPVHLDRLERSQPGNVCKLEYRMRHKNGEWRWFCTQDRVYSRTQDGRLERILGIARDITNRQQAQTALKESEERLKLATVASGMGMWFWDLVADTLEWTEQCKAIFGLPADAELSYEKFINILHPDDRDRAREANAQALANQVEYRIEYRAIWSDGSVHWIVAKGRGFYNLNGEPVRMMGTVQDISDREASKQALMQREQELKLITEVIPQQIWTASANGEVDYFNQRWIEYTGIPLEETVNSDWSIILHPEESARFRSTWAESVSTGRKYNMEARLRGADGVYRWFLVKARPLRNQQGKIIRWYGTNTSITHIKKLEERLRQQTEDLIKANQLKDEFLAIVSHELRTPLNPILGWSQLLAAGKLDPEKTAAGITIIERNAKLQTQLIDDLLDVSRILRGKLNLNQTPLDLEMVIKSALTTVQLAGEVKSIQIKTEFEPNIGQVLGDAGRIQQIIWNLLSNAIKFTPEGGHILVKLGKIGTQALIQVQDTGQGIDSEFLPHVFDRFRQAEGGNTRQFGGLGLGLAIVRHLSQLHGGTVAVASEGKGKGASFSVKLPLMDTPTVEPIDINPIEPSVKLNRFSGIKILVVDDEVDSLDILTLVLEQEGAEVISVASAAAALEALSKLTPDLIVSDIGMPKTDGYTLMSQIRHLSEGKNIPAIALTAYAGEVNQQLSLEAGFNRHLAKPINIPELIAAITELVQ